MRDGDTAVVLPLRDAAAVDAVRAQLAGLEPTLMLALPALTRDRRPDRRLASGPSGRAVRRHVSILHDGDTTSTWSVGVRRGPCRRSCSRTGRPRNSMSIAGRSRWALPVDDAGGRLVALPESVARVVRAPTAVDDPLTLPAVLIASYPLDSSRRRVTPGALADAIAHHAAQLLAEEMADLPPDPSLLRLVPTGFPDGSVDGGLHAAVLEQLQETAWLPLATEADVRQRPRDALVVADPLVAVLSQVVPSLLPARLVTARARGLGCPPTVAGRAGRGPRCGHAGAGLVADPLCRA